VSSSSEDEDGSYREEPNHTAINGEIDFITSIIENEMKMSGKDFATDCIEDDASDTSDVSVC